MVLCRKLKGKYLDDQCLSRFIHLQSKKDREQPSWITGFIYFLLSREECWLLLHYTEYICHGSRNHLTSQPFLIMDFPNLHLTVLQEATDNTEKVKWNLLSWNLAFLVIILTLEDNRLETRTFNCLSLFSTDCRENGP